MIFFKIFYFSILINFYLNFSHFSAERELAIVSNISGTTRDCLETRLHLDGQLVNVVDTAGIRTDTDDPLEREGIRRSLERAESANIVLLVLDGSRMDGNEKEEVEELLARFNHRRGEQRVIVCLNKEDLVEEADKEGMRRRMEMGGDFILNYFNFFI